MKLKEAFAKRQAQPRFVAGSESIMLKMFKKYAPEILEGIAQYVQNTHGRTMDFKDPEHLAMALDEVFSVIASEMEYIMDEADKDGMVGEWFEDY